MDTFSHKIRPILHCNVHIQNIRQYNDFRRKRPSKTLNLKFVAEEKSFPLQEEVSRKSQIALIQILKLLKSVPNIDLSEIKLDSFYLKPERTLSIFKRISKAKTLSAVRYQHHFELGNTFAEEWVKYLTRITRLSYNMQGVGLFSRFPPYLEQQENQIEVKDTRDPLKYLRCCPKIESLEIDAFGPNYLFSRTFKRFNQYPALKQLAIKAPVDAEEIDLTQERFKKLESFHLSFEPGYEPEFVLHNIQAISTLPKLKELSLLFQRDVLDFPGIDLALKKIAEKGLLKKLKLNFEFNLFSHENVLKALQSFSKLTSFALMIRLKDDSSLPLIYEGLKTMNQLERLSLNIGINGRFKGSKDFEAISQLISIFEKLAHVNLDFDSSGGPPEKKERIPSFIPHLKPLFAKPIKIKTFALKIAQLDPAEAYPQIFDLLGDSTKTISKLRIYLGSYSPTAKVKQQAILDFIKSLENIRVLRLPGIAIASQNYFDQLAEVIYPFRYLRTFELGNIQGKVKKEGALSAVETIIKKRGLRKFNCVSSIDLDIINRREVFSLLFGIAEPPAAENEDKGPPVDMDSVMNMNPYLEFVKLKYIMTTFPFFDKLRQWA